jgi:hypothetical protein
MKIFNKEEAIAFYNSDEWKDWTDQQIVDFQMRQPLVCVPFMFFKGATERLLDREVGVLEFGEKRIENTKKELEEKHGNNK